MRPPAGAILLAAGNSRRLPGRRRKPFLDLGGLPVFMHSVRAFARLPEVREIVLVAPARDLPGLRRRWGRSLARLKVRAIVEGGPARPLSVRNGLRVLSDRCRVVAIHDAARPFVAPETIRAVLAQAARHGGATCAVPVADTLHRTTDEGRIRQTVPRRQLWAAQTPQAFRKERLTPLLNRTRAPASWSDDAAMVRAFGFEVRVVPGDPGNFKITTRADLALARKIARKT